MQKDIENTEKTDDADKKRKWLDAWRNGILSGANIPHEYATEYFVEDEDLLYDGIYELAKDKSNFGWFYLLTQELALFEPYCALGGDDDSEYKKLKRQYDSLTFRTLHILLTVCFPFLARIYSYRPEAFTSSGLLRKNQVLPLVCRLHFATQHFLAPAL